MGKFKPWLKDKLEWLHHVYWIGELLVSTGAWTAIVKWAIQHEYIAQIYEWPLILVLVGLSMFLLLWLFPLKTKEKDPNVAQATSAALVISSPQAGVTPGVDFDQFFRAAYRTTIEAEVRQNFYLTSRQRQPNDPEKFYLDFIGIGFIAALYDSIWYPMFRSQLLALQEVNKHGGLLPVAKVKEFYDAAAREFPGEYQTDTFERWLTYLTKNVLVIHHPSDMVEITVRGRDFLKFLAHWGRDAKGKRL